MLRYLIHAMAIALVWAVLPLAPADAGACAYAVDAPHAAVEFRASSSYAIQSHQHEHGRRGVPCDHGDCILCCPACSFAPVSCAVIFAQPIGALDLGTLLFDPPSKATLPDIRLTLLPFRPPRTLG